MTGAELSWLFFDEAGWRTEFDTDREFRLFAA